MMFIVLIVSQRVFTGKTRDDTSERKRVHTTMNIARGIGISRNHFAFQLHRAKIRVGLRQLC